MVHKHEWFVYAFFAICLVMAFYGEYKLWRHRNANKPKR